MDDGWIGFTIGALTAGIFISVLLHSNLDREISPKVMKHGELICEQNDGLEIVSFDSFDYEFKCLNGAIFYDYKMEEKLK